MPRRTRDALAAEAETGCIADGATVEVESAQPVAIPPREETIREKRQRAGRARAAQRWGPESVGRPKKYPSWTSGYKVEKKALGVSDYVYWGRSVSEMTDEAKRTLFGRKLLVAKMEAMQQLHMLVKAPIRVINVQQRIAVAKLLVELEVPAPPKATKATEPEPEATPAPEAEPIVEAPPMPDLKLAEVS